MLAGGFRTIAFWDDLTIKTFMQEMRRLKRAKLISQDDYDQTTVWKRNNRNINYWQAFNRMKECLQGEAYDALRALTDHLVFDEDFKIKMYYNVPKN